MAVFDRKEIEERLKQKAIERERKEHIRKLTSPAYRKKLKQKLRIIIQFHYCKLNNKHYQKKEKL